MLKTNSKQAHQNIRAYITAHARTPEYDSVQSFEEAQTEIVNSFNFYAKGIKAQYAKAGRIFPHYEAFKDWTSGLPGALDCSYYLNNAVNDLAIILEETPEEANRYSQDKAEKLLTYLVYKEVFR